MNKKDIVETFTRLRDQNPNPQSELNYHNNFTLLVAVVLSAQATDKGVNKATDKLFEIADNPKDMYALGLDGLKEYIKTIGLYNSKANNVIKLCKILIDEYDGEIPDSREELQKLPGVGRKTANVVMNIAFGEPTIAVDTHVFRLSNRLGLAKGKTPDEVESGLSKIVPSEFKLHAHHWLILHGRYVCKAQKPTCSTCILKDLCPSAKIL